MYIYIYIYIYIYVKDLLRGGHGADPGPRPEGQRGAGLPARHEGRP